MAKGKFVIPIVAFSLILSSPMAYADENNLVSIAGVQKDISNIDMVSKAKAMEIAINAFPEMKNYKNIEEELVDNYGLDLHKVWKIYSKDDEKFNIYVNAASGEVENFCLNKKYVEGRNYVPRYTKNECKSLAEKLIMNLNPSKFKETVYKDISVNTNYYESGIKNPVLYTFYYPRIIDGTSYVNDGFRVTIDATTGQTVDYEYKWSYFINNDDLIKLDDAKEKFKEYAQPRLMYIRSFGNTSGSQSNLKLIYSIPLGVYYNTNFNGIDAVTGEAVDFDGNGTKVYVERLENDSDKNDSSEVESTHLNLSNDDYKDAVKIVLDEIGKYNISLKDYSSKISDFDKNLDGKGTRAFILQWNNNNDDKSFIKAVVNADTGKIQELNCVNQSLSWQKPENADWENSLKNAEEFVKQNLSDKKNELIFIGSKPKEGKSGSGMYNFTFIRVADSSNQALFPENYVSVSVDKTSGNVTGFSYKWEDIQFPVFDKVIDQEKASEIYLNSTGLQLNLKNLSNNVDDSNTGKLVYEAIPENVAYIDAVTGKIKDYNGNDYKKETSNNNLTGIQLDNKIQHQAEIFNDIGIIKINENMNFNSNISKVKFIKMLVELNGTNQLVNDDNINERNYDYYVEEAKKLGWIEEKSDIDTNSTLTRQEAAGILVKFMGYDDLNKVKSLVKTDFKDLNKFDKSYVIPAGILKSLNIMDTNSSNNFEPTRKVTISEAIDTIYKTLLKLK